MILPTELKMLHWLLQPKNSVGSPKWGCEFGTYNQFFDCSNQLSVVYIVLWYTQLSIRQSESKESHSNQQTMIKIKLIKNRIWNSKSRKNRNKPKYPRRNAVNNKGK